MSAPGLPAGIPSKKAVDRAGKTWRDFTTRDTRRVTADELDKLVEAERLMSLWRSAHARPLDRVAANLRYYTPVYSTGRQEVSQRLKKFPTMVSKLQREPHMALTRMTDIGGCRALFNHQTEIDAAVAKMLKNWTGRGGRTQVLRVRNYVKEPKLTGYRAVHLHVCHGDRMIEVQLRTYIQDLWAKFVENEERRLARRGWLVKDGRGPAELLDYYRVTSEVLALVEREEPVDMELYERLRAATDAARPHLGSVLVELTDPS